MPKVPLPSGLVGGNVDIRVSIVVSISACHADDPGSIPGRGANPDEARICTVYGRSLHIDMWATAYFDLSGTGTVLFLTG